MSRIAEGNNDPSMLSSSIRENYEVGHETANQLSQKNLHVMKNTESIIILEVQPSASKLRYERSRSCLKLGRPQPNLEQSSEYSETDGQNNAASSSDQDESYRTDPGLGRKSELLARSCVDLAKNNEQLVQNSERSIDIGHDQNQTRRGLIQANSVDLYVGLKKIDT